MKNNNSAKPTRQSTVLIVDSSPEFRTELVQAFHRLGLKVILVGTGNEVLDVVCWIRSPVLVIIDMILPDMSGLELATRLKRERSIPLIITGYQDEPSVIAGLLDLIADDYVRKPLDTRELAARGLRLIESTQRISALRGDKHPEEIKPSSLATFSGKLVH